MLQGISSMISAPWTAGAYDPCIDNEVAVYLNRPDVQAAMHANTTGLIPGPWADCTDLVDYSRKDLLTSMLPVYKELLKTGAHSQHVACVNAAHTRHNFYPPRAQAIVELQEFALHVLRMF